MSRIAKRAGRRWRAHKSPPERADERRYSYYPEDGSPPYRNVKLEELPLEVRNKVSEFLRWKYA
jgi:hypothetical protein